MLDGGGNDAIDDTSKGTSGVVLRVRKRRVGRIPAAAITLLESSAGEVETAELNGYLYEDGD